MNPKVLYRTEDAYGSGVRDLKKILQHEVFELGNTDILEYTLNHYINDKKIQDFIVKSKIGGIQIDNFYISTIYIARELTDSNDSRKLFNRMRQIFGKSIAEAAFIESFLQLIQIATGRTVKYGLWLADKSIVEEYYEGQNIDSYVVSDIILSDLGAEGKLFAYTDLPQPLESNTAITGRSQNTKTNEIMRW